MGQKHFSTVWEAVKMRKYYVFQFILILCLSLTLCASATVLTLPTGVKTIETEAFYGDTSLDEVILPEGVTTIGARAFANSSVKKINLPSSLTTINSTAFNNTSLSQITANWNTKGSKWAIEHAIKLVTPASSMSFSSVATVTSAGNSNANNGTDVTAYINKCFTVHDVTGGWFKFVAPTGGRYTFSVKAPNVSESFIIRIYAIRNGERKEIKQFTYSKVSDIVTYTLPDVTAGETIYWWDARTSNTGYTAQSDFLLRIAEYDKIAPTSIWDTIPTVVTGTDEFYEIGQDLYGVLLKLDDKPKAGWILTAPADGYYTFEAWNTSTTNEADIWLYTGKYNDGGQINQKMAFAANSTAPVSYDTQVFAAGQVLTWWMPRNNNGSLVFREGLKTIITFHEAELPVIYPETIVLSEHEYTLRVDGNFPLTATLTPSDVSDEARGITWTSSDPDVAYYNNGKVFANEAGTAVITAETVNGLYDYCQVIVEPDAEVTGGFDESSIAVLIGSEAELRYHVNVQYGTLKNVRLKYGTKYISTKTYSNKTDVTGSFTITAGPEGMFDSSGKYTVSLVATASDNTEKTLGTAEIYVKYDYPTKVTGIEAEYSSGKIYVSWTNNGDATKFKIIYLELGNPYNMPLSVNVNDSEAEEGTITGITVGKAYNVYVCSYNDTGYWSPMSDPCQVLASNSSTPVISARFSNDQTVYAPGETINIELNYANIIKVHYINGDTGYNSNSLNTSLSAGDYPSESGWTSNRTGTKTVQLKAQNVAGDYIVEIWAINLAGTHATGSYNYTMGTGSVCLALSYTVKSGGLSAPTWTDITPRGSVTNLRCTFSTVSGATGYRILYGASSNPSAAYELGKTQNSGYYDVTGIRNGTYYFFVQAYNASGFGRISAGIKKIVQSLYPPKVSATLNKKVYAPGENISITVTYENIKKVHYQNECGSDDIWSNTSQKENATTNISGSRTVTLTAPSTNGSYSVKIWAKNKDDEPATSSYGSNGCLELSYTVSGAPTVSITPTTATVFMNGTERQVWFDQTTTNAESLKVWLIDPSGAEVQYQNAYYKEIGAYSNPEITYDKATLEANKGLCVVFPKGCAGGTWQIKAVAYNVNTSGSTIGSVPVIISVKVKDAAEIIVSHANSWLTTTFPVANMPKYTNTTTVRRYSSSDSRSFHGLPYIGAGEYRTRLSEYENLEPSDRQLCKENYTYSGHTTSSAYYGIECTGFVLACWREADSRIEVGIGKKVNITAQKSAKIYRYNFGTNNTSALQYAKKGDCISKGDHNILVIDNNTKDKILTVIEQTANLNGDKVNCDCDSCRSGNTISLGTRLTTYNYTDLNSYYNLFRLGYCYLETDGGNWAAIN